MEEPRPRRPPPPFEYEATVTSVETAVSRHVILYSWHNCADVSVEPVALPSQLPVWQACGLVVQGRVERQSMGLVLVVSL